ncbi:hypothetical protein CKC_04030 [Candidatus Liberibacter solanacearum CLso-ZC1]|uniref:Uncharacterized protein n=1 Tax=Liberibacter solanacearum (strain CLso-ZC1) TaxID=658172 RepID=E4UB76_LIBSC|nr:hypothetical protein [Candidatus Liberibacter solanacearum]ADR52555.1 hypothetical protein CKC_04030 [Candidatus Liberibacter solanacearum CLso-ZC1]
MNIQLLNQVSDICNYHHGKPDKTRVDILTLVGRYGSHEVCMALLENAVIIHAHLHFLQKYKDDHELKELYQKLQRSGDE